MSNNNIQALVITADNSVGDINSNALLQFMAQEWGLTNYSDARANDRQLDHIISKNRKPPDLIICEYSGKSLSYNLWSKIIEAWGGIPFMLHINGEGTQAPNWSNPADYHLSFQPSSKNNMQFHATLLSPFIAPMLMAFEQGIDHSVYNSETLKLSYKLHKNFKSTPKHKFCNFIYSNHAHATHKTLYSSKLDGLSKRQELCQLISSYKSVDCPGASMHNTDNLKVIEDGHEKWCAEHLGEPLGEQKFPVEKRFLAKLRYMSNYKFTIAGENITSLYYISEKIIHPLIVGSIPIYIGCKEIPAMVNPKAFINCNDYNSLAEVAYLVRQIDNDPKLYNQYISQPPFLKDSLAYNYSKENLRESLSKVHTELVKHQHKHEKYTSQAAAYGESSWLKRKYTQIKNSRHSAVIWLWLWQLLVQAKQLVRP